MVVEALEAGHPIYGTFRVRSDSGHPYEVEICSLGAPAACGCVDHRVSRLGTCKHIEGTLDALRRRGARAFRDAGTQAANVSRSFWTGATTRARLSHGLPAATACGPCAPGCGRS